MSNTLPTPRAPLLNNSPADKACRAFGHTMPLAMCVLVIFTLNKYGKLDEYETQAMGFASEEEAEQALDAYVEQNWDYMEIEHDARPYDETGEMSARARWFEQTADRFSIHWINATYPVTAIGEKLKRWERGEKNKREQDRRVA